MPNTTISNMYYMGNFADVDPDESNYNAENGTDLIGITSSSTDNLELIAISNYDNNDTSTIGDNDINGTGSAGDNITYSIDGGASTTVDLDSTLVGTALVPRGDGTTFTANVLIIQSATGDVFVTNLIGNDSLDNEAIQQIQITSISVTDSEGYFNQQTTINGSVVCFVAGTMIECLHGQVPIESLEVGDLVKTLDNGYRPLRWIGKTQISPGELAANDRLRPIRIRASALAENCPASDLLVSRQHRMLVKSDVAKNIFGTDEVLVPANKLLPLEGVLEEQADAHVTYVHLLFDDHEIVLANGAPSESLYTGPEALKTIPESSRDEIFTLFPELLEIDYKAKSARHIPQKGVDVKAMIAEHKNSKAPLLSI